MFFCRHWLSFPSNPHISLWQTLPMVLILPVPDGAVMYCALVFPNKEKESEKCSNVLYNIRSNSQKSVFMLTIFRVDF